MSTQSPQLTIRSPVEGTPPAALKEAADRLAERFLDPATRAEMLSMILGDDWRSLLIQSTNQDGLCSNCGGAWPCGVCH
ncbi:MAG: hypothetical protein GEU93_06220 [Propionibacteriales bacterium]|nr:hypothetical protein [Propionibacteriales bacterium]